MSEALERRYQLALDWYPKAWRETHAEAMLGTLLDEAEATGRTTPRLADLTNLRLFGLQTRLTRLPHVVPVEVRDRVAAISFGTGFAIALIMFLGVEWAPWATNGPWNGWAQDWRIYGTTVPGFGPFASAGVVFYGLWMAAFGLAFLGFARTASFTLFATFPASLLLVDLSADRMVLLRPIDAVLVLMATLALLAMAGRPTRPGQKMQGAKWLAASAGIAVLAPGYLAAKLIYDDGGSKLWPVTGRLGAWQVWSDLNSPGLYLAVIVVLIGVALLIRNRTWAIALSLYSAVWVASLLLLAFGTDGASGIVGWSGPLAAVAAVVALGVVRVRGYRIVLQRR